LFPEIAIDEVPVTIHRDPVGDRAGGQGAEFGHLPVLADLVHGGVTASAIYIIFFVDNHAFRFQDPAAKDLDGIYRIPRHAHALLSDSLPSGAGFRDEIKAAARAASSLLSSLSMTAI
jgi:hypothetical protein